MTQWSVGKVLAAFIAMLFYAGVKYVGASFFTYISYLIFGLIIVYLVFSILVTLIYEEGQRSKLIGHKPTSITRIKLFFTLFFYPLKFIVIAPDRNTRFECPRCSDSDFYASQEQVTTGAVGGIIDNPVGGYGVMIPMSYNTVVKRCKNCNTEMDEYVNPDFYAWRERWYSITFFIYTLVILFIVIEIFYPWAENNL